MWWYFVKKPTPSEYAVLVVSASVLFVVVGVVALLFAIRAPARKHDLAIALTHLSIWCAGIGVAIASAYSLFRRLKD